MIQKPRGTQDVLPKQIAVWQYIEQQLRDACTRFNYQEIRTPMFEHIELFKRGVGDTTDIVSKEMYDFFDKGNRHIALRPEGTASTVRAYVENKLYGETDIQKLYYLGPMFRYERAQKGRLRQFNQFGIEALGSFDPLIDAEVVALAMEIYANVGLKNIKLVINSLGDLESRMAHRQALVEHFTPVMGELCQDCQTRLEKNPLRILDCKVDAKHESMQSAPQILNYLNTESKNYFQAVLAALTAMEIPYTVDANLVRGLDYYNHTAFEIVLDDPSFGAQTTLCGGGRYNGLVEQLGGPATPGIGFGLGIERLVLALEQQEIALPFTEQVDVYFMGLGQEARIASARLIHQLRQNGVSVETDYQGRGMKAMFKAANRAAAKFAVILGEEELAQGICQVKNLQAATQKTVSVTELVTYLVEANK
ncbi:MAG: histidine--tRNA ligase [Culicoidibacterales bacterium]